MLAFILIGPTLSLIVAALLLILVIALVILDGRASLSLLNAKELTPSCREGRILSNVCFRLGVEVPVICESARYAGNAFSVQSVFHRGWVILGTDLKRRLSDEELEQLFSVVAMRKKVREYSLMVPISSLLMILNLPFWVCEKYNLQRLHALVSVFISPFNALISKLSHRRSLTFKVEQLLESSLGAKYSNEAAWGKFTSNGVSSLYQALSLLPLSLQPMSFDDPLLRVLFERSSQLPNMMGGEN